MKPLLLLPPNSSKLGCEAKELHIVEDDKNVVIVGANGSGKSKLGAWIEARNPFFTTPSNSQSMELTAEQRELLPKAIHRISAQRVLRIQEIAPKKNFEESEMDLLWGQHQSARYETKWDHRWQRLPTNWELNDYDNLLSNLFAQEAKRDHEYAEDSIPRAQRQEKTQPVPLSNFQILNTIWEQVFPNISLKFHDGKVETKTKRGIEFPGRKMSDGERVGLYLIGQCLSVPEKSIIIIDEPEIHLHKAILCRLWDVLEAERASCRFVYITHDLEFAASRTGAKKIWVKSYSTDNHSDERSAKEGFEWEEVPESEPFPEELIFKILGGRQKVLFTEGVGKSLDKNLYEVLFPEFLIEPRGSWEKVVEAVKAFRSNPHLHHQEAFGIIDRDYHRDNVLTQFREDKIFTLEVAELENLLCTEPVVKHIAEHLGEDPTEKFELVKSTIIDTVKKELNTHISHVVVERLRNELGQKFVGYSFKRTLHSNY